MNMLYRSSCKSLYVNWAVKFKINGTWGHVKNGEFRKELLFETAPVWSVNTSATTCGQEQAIYVSTKWGMAGMLFSMQVYVYLRLSQILFLLIY